MAITPGYISPWAFTAGGTSLSTSAGATQATGSTFFAIVNIGVTGGATITSVTDNFGNTYELVGSVAFGFGNSGTYLYCCINGVGGASHVLSAVISTAEYFQLQLTEFENVGAGSIDQAPTGTFVNGGTTLAAPSITTSVADELIVNVFGCSQSNTQTLTDSGAPFSVASSWETNAQPNSLLSWATPSSTGTYADTLSATTSSFWGALALSIIPGGSGPPLTGIQYVRALGDYWGPPSSATLTEGPFTPNLNDAIIVFAGAAGYLQPVSSVSGTGTYTLLGGPWVDTDDDGNSIYGNSSAAAISQMVTITGAGDVVGLVVEYSSVTALGAVAFNTQASPGTGIGAVVGTPVVVPVGCVLLVLAVGTSTSNGNLTPTSGITREIWAGNGSNQDAQALVEYTGTGASITPTFTFDQTTDNTAVMQILLYGLPQNYSNAPAPRRRRQRGGLVMGLNIAEWF